MGHLHPFGCIAYARVPNELIRSKLDPRSVKYVMVGYSTHGYRLYNRNTRLIITSRDVIFEEGVGHRPMAYPDEDDLVSSTPIPVNPVAPPIPPP